MYETMRTFADAKDTQDLQALSFIDKNLIDSLGPGVYNPKVDAGKKGVKAPTWSNSRSKRVGISDPTDVENPGPGHYNQQ